MWDAATPVEAVTMTRLSKSAAKRSFRSHRVASRSTRVLPTPPPPEKKTLLPALMTAMTFCWSASSVNPVGSGCCDADSPATVSASAVGSGSRALGWALAVATNLSMPIGFGESDADVVGAATVLAVLVGFGVSDAAMVGAATAPTVRGAMAGGGK